MQTLFFYLPLFSFTICMQNYINKVIRRQYNVLKNIIRAYQCSSVATKSKQKLPPVRTTV